MSELKPFMVTLTYSGVVMAKNLRDAEVVAERHQSDIVSDQCYPSFDDVTEVLSLAHLKRLDPGWEPDCAAYGEGSPRLRDVLPEEDPPARDDKTLDMFAAAATGGAHG